MPFDFFNPGRTGWGKKITAAFNLLDDLLNDARENISYVSENIDYYRQFITNYRAPEPMNPDAPVRSDEVYNQLTDKVYIKLTENNNQYTIEYSVMTAGSNRPTRYVGTTNLDKGFAFASPPQSLTNLESNITFKSTEKYDGKQVLLFQFSIDKNTKTFYMHNPAFYFGSQPCDDTHLHTVSIGANLNLPYTANNYEGVIFTHNDTNKRTGGQPMGSNIYKNGVLLSQSDSGLIQCMPFGVLYLKPGDQLTGTNIQQLFRFHYNR